ncbi:MAG: hypothetical protein ACLP59_24065 [Bryobacteraceae bacterium]
MKSLLILILPAGLWAQTCTVTNTVNCPASGSPTAGDQFGDTVTWISSPFGVFAAPEGGMDFQDFTAGAGTAFSGIMENFGSYPSNNILYAAEFSPLNQNFFLSDPATCATTGPPTCLYDNIAYAEAFADSLFKPLGQGGLGLTGTDINLDPGPWFTASQYANFCAAYSSSTVTAGSACFPASFSQELTQWLNTYTTVLNYITANYPQVQIHFAPTPSADIWNTCGLTVIANRTEAAVEACMVPLYQTMVSMVNSGAPAGYAGVARVTALHEAAGAWGLFCGACPFLSSTANVDTFLQHASTAIKTVSPATSVGVGGAYSEMGITNGEYTCPNSPRSLNYWCDYTTIDPFLDYVGMDVYPSSNATSSEYAAVIGTPEPQPSTYNFMAQRVRKAPYSLGLFVNEASGLRWSIPGGPAGSGEVDTYLGSGWIGWNVTNVWSGWLNSAAIAWAQAIGAQGWDYFDTPALLCLSSDPNNTHTAPDTDNYMAICMPSLPAVSALGTMYGGVAQAAVAPFTVRSSAVGQIQAFAAESIVAAYAPRGTNLATGTASATTVPLQNSLNGNSVTVTDAAGMELPAPLYYVSPSQINFEIPAGLATGLGVVSIHNQNGTTLSATMQLGSVSPGIYSLNGPGGLAAAWVLPVLNQAQQPLQPVYQVVSGKVVGLPINVSQSNEQVYLEMYGTGIRNAMNVTATVGSLAVPVLYAGASGYVGEDQVNIGPLPPALAGQGSVNIILTADGKEANPVNVTIQ